MQDVTPHPVPVQTPDNSAVLATMIQETIQSMQGNIPTTTTSPGSPEPEEPTATLESHVPSLFPHTIYFLAPGTNGKDQIWRMDKNGSGISVLTAEANGIENYDFSKSNGLLAYLTNNRIVIADSEGKIIRSSLKAHQMMEKISGISHNESVLHFGHLMAVKFLTDTTD